MLAPRSVPISGHLWTIGKRVAHRPLGLPAEPWSTVLEDPRVGPVRLTGLLREVPEARGLVLLVHGLGGCVESHYMERFAREAERQELSCLRLNQRGADRLGEDLYHAGLIDDIDAALASPELKAYERLWVLGCSLGGHVVLRWAVESHHPRVRAAAAVCAPLDLKRSAEFFSYEALYPYRRHVLSGIFDIYRQVAARRPVPLPVEEARCLRTLWDWDERVASPRFGFSGAEDYYEQMSVGPTLSRLELPSLWAGSFNDPMVPRETVRPSLEAADSALEVRWTRRGGHLGFPRDLDLGIGTEPGLERQVLEWLMRW